MADCFCEATLALKITAPQNVSNASTAYVSTSGVVVNTIATGGSAPTNGILTINGTTYNFASTGGITNGAIQVTQSGNNFTMSNSSTSATIIDAANFLMSAVMGQEFLISYYSNTLARTIVITYNSVTLSPVISTNIAPNAVAIAAHNKGYYIVGCADGTLIIYGSNLQPVWQLNLTNPITAVGGQGCYLVVGTKTSDPSPLISPQATLSPNLFIYKLHKFVPNQFTIPEICVVTTRYTGDDIVSVASFGQRVFVAYNHYWITFIIELEECGNECREIVRICQYMSCGPNPTLSMVKNQMVDTLVVATDADSTYAMVTLWTF